MIPCVCALTVLTGRLDELTRLTVEEKAPEEPCPQVKHDKEDKETGQVKLSKIREEQPLPRNTEKQEEEFEEVVPQEVMKEERKEDEESTEDEGTKEDAKKADLTGGLHNGAELGGKDSRTFLQTFTPPVNSCQSREEEAEKVRSISKEVVQEGDRKAAGEDEEYQGSY